MLMQGLEIVARRPIEQTEDSKKLFLSFVHFAEIFCGQFYPCGFTVCCLSTMVLSCPPYSWEGRAFVENSRRLAEMYRICYNGPSKKRSTTMAVRYTEEQLNTVDKALLIQMFRKRQIIVSDE